MTAVSPGCSALIWPSGLTSTTASSLVRKSQSGVMSSFVPSAKVGFNLKLAAQARLLKKHIPEG